MIFELATTKIRIKRLLTRRQPEAEPVEITDWERVGLMYNGVRYEWLKIPSMTVINGNFVGFSYNAPLRPIHFKPVKMGAYSPSTGLFVEAV